MNSILLSLAFILELVAFISFAAFGYVFDISNTLRVIVFVVLLVALIMFWSVYMAPKAPKKLSPQPYYLAKTIIYAISTVTLFATRGPANGVSFVLLAVIDELLLRKHNLAKD